MNTIHEVMKMLLTMLHFGDWISKLHKAELIDFLPSMILSECLIILVAVVVENVGELGYVWAG